MREVPGYRSVDLTRLTESNGGQFPRQEVYDAIDGRKRFPAHIIGDMPAWGLKYQPDNRGPESEENVRRRIFSSRGLRRIAPAEADRKITCSGSLTQAFRRNSRPEFRVPHRSPPLYWQSIYSSSIKASRISVVETIPTSLPSSATGIAPILGSRSRRAAS